MPSVRTAQAAGGGWPAKFGKLSSIQAHVGACEVQIVIAGRAISGSFSVPTRMNIRCGRDSASLNKWTPQTGQKRRCILLPLSAVLEKSAREPSMTTQSRAKQAFTLPLPAPRYWQSRHQHMRVTMGAAAAL